MFGFKKRAAQPVRIEDVEGLAPLLHNLDERITELEQQDALVKLEVADWYEKFRALYARLNKRVARAEEAAPAEPAPTNPAAMRILGGMRG